MGEVSTKYFLLSGRRWEVSRGSQSFRRSCPGTHCHWSLKCLQIEKVATVGRREDFLLAFGSQVLIKLSKWNYIVVTRELDTGFAVTTAIATTNNRRCGPAEAIGAALQDKNFKASSFSMSRRSTACFPSSETSGRSGYWHKSIANSAQDSF